ncbi:MAG TPA: hypothetical protein VLI05_00455 [Candidatus Saccharimonadia bacterium]|nr:hypothetical protein [Candidatus Saccharimonadia bacterium]
MSASNPTGLRVLLDWRPVAVAIVMIGFIANGGLTAPWHLGPVFGALFVIATMWLPVVAFAYLQRTLSIRNPGFLLGDPMLGVGIGLSTLALTVQPDLLHAAVWFNSPWFMWGLVIGWYVLGLTNEYFGVWRNPTHKPVRMSDWWHHAFYGVMGYWTVYALVSTGYQFFAVKMTWIFPAVVLFALAWVYCIWLQVSRANRPVYEFGLNTPLQHIL